ncbi:MAG: DUF359 domain-containing protein, partial [Ignisphaera sp.]
MRLYILPNNLRKILAELHVYAKDSLTVMIGSKEYVGLSLRAKLYCDLHRVAVIGDTVCHTFLKFVGIPRICVIDGKSLRMYVNYAAEIMECYDCVTRCSNPPGTISQECLDVLNNMINSHRQCLVIVNGEEDLLALAVALNPYKITYIVYGIPSKGIAVIDGEKFIETAINLFSQFKSS